MARGLVEFARGPSIVLRIGEFSLIWQAFRPCDNLHVFSDGIFVGKITFDEAEQNSAITHPENLPNDLNPLLTGVSIRHNSQTIEAFPCGITPIYACRESVSDMQLLLAAIERLQPAPARFNILATAGHFPGDSTLFDEVRKIPFPGKYNLQSHEHVRLAEFSLRPASDELMLERLLSLTPDVPSQLGMSGGYDSRFVLGLLLRRGIRPMLVCEPCDERNVVEAIARELRLELELPENLERLSPHIYTLMTDAQLYLRGGNYSRFRGSLSRNCVYHTGLAADSIIKKTYKATWKFPGPRSRIFDKLCNFAMLGMKEARLRGVHDASDRADLVALVRRELSFLPPHQNLWVNSGSGRRPRL